MKKFVIITLIFAMAAGTAFAQTADGISINAWGRGVFAPIQVYGKAKAYGEAVTTPKVEVGGEAPSGGDYYLDTEDGVIKQNKPEPGYPGTLVDGPGAVSYAGAGVTWGGHRIRSDFRINGNAEFVGFQIQLSGEDASINDNQYIWAKPFSNDILKLYVGHFDVDNLRGKIATDTGFEDFVLNPMNEDVIFHRFRAGGGDPNNAPNAPNGFMLSSAPIEGLFIGFRVNGSLFDNWGNGHKTLAGDAYRFMQAGFGYEIADIGHLRAQFIGGWFGKLDWEKIYKAMGKHSYEIEPSLDGDTARIEAAFALTAIDNLLIDLGLKFWLPISDKDGYYKASNGINVALGARYRMEAFQVVAHINSGFAGYTHDYNENGGKKAADDKSMNPLTLAVNLIPTYDLDFATLGLSLGMKMKGNGFDVEGKGPEKDEYKTNTSQFGFGGFIQKGLGSGNVKFGLAYKTAEIARKGDKKGANGSGVFTIPVILEYAFF